MKTEEDPLIQSWERLWLRAGSGLRSPLRILAWIFVGTAGLFLGLYLWGLSLPAMLMQRQEISCRLPQAEAYAMLRKVSAYPKWRSDVRRVEVVPASQAGAKEKQGGEQKQSLYYREYYTRKKFFFYKVHFGDQEIVFELLPGGIEATASHAVPAHFRGKVTVRLKSPSLQEGGFRSRVLFIEESYYPNPFRRSIARLAAGRRLQRYAKDFKKACRRPMRNG